MDILSMALEQQTYTTALRRHFHENPECGPAEQVKTMAYIEQELDTMGIRYVRVPGGGIFGFLEGAKPGKTVLLRSDIDALPMSEDPNNLVGPKACVSRTPGIAHTCGHDAHTAMLLTEAKILSSMREKLEGRVLFMFEEGEEGHGNIRELCRYMEKQRIAVDTAYACHVRWNVPAGKIGLCQGTSLSGLYHFIIELEGHSGHGSRPDMGANVIDCFNRICSGLQMVRMTRIRPDTSLTYSVCSVHAGTCHNILPDHLKAEGSIRFADVNSGEVFLREFRRIVGSESEITGCRGKVTISETLLPTIAFPVCAQLLHHAVEQSIGRENVVDCGMWMASESFCYMTSMIPCAFAYVGIENPEKGCGANHHTPQFDADEDALPYGVAAAIAYTLAFLQEKPDVSAFRPLVPTMTEFVELLMKE